MKLLLSQDVAAELRHALKSPIAFDAERRAKFMVDAATRRGGVLTTGGDVARISVGGLLTKSPSFLAMLLGAVNTTYAEISDALAAADADPSVSRIVLDVDSPGGTVAGLFACLQSIEATTKPITVQADMACSAAYAIAATAGKITAVTSASEFGSIGVAMSIYVDPNVVDIASTEAPGKRPNVRTDDGQATVRAELDAIHDLFVGAITKGRRTTATNVNANFGRGGVVLAAAARRAGMIDAIGSASGAGPGPSSAVASSPPAQIAAGWLPPRAAIARRFAAEARRMGARK